MLRFVIPKGSLQLFAESVSTMIKILNDYLISRSGAAKRNDAANKYLCICHFEGVKRLRNLRTSFSLDLRFLAKLEMT
jgi:hypothetical protein